MKAYFIDVDDIDNVSLHHNTQVGYISLLKSASSKIDIAKLMNAADIHIGKLSNITEMMFTVYENCTIKNKVVDGQVRIQLKYSTIRSCNSSDMRYYIINDILLHL